MFVSCKFRGYFSQVQLVNLKNKTMCTFQGYLAIETKKFQKFHKQITGKKVSCKKKQKKTTTIW